MKDIVDMIDQLTGPAGFVSVAYFQPNWIDAELLKAAAKEVQDRYILRDIAFPPTACERVVAALFSQLK